MSKRKIAIGTTVIILLTVGLVWALRNRDDPQLERIRQLHMEAFKEGQTPEQRRKNFELIHQEMEKLNPEQRQAIWSQRGREFGHRMDQRIDDYIALTPEERVAFLDKAIQEMEKRRKEWEARRQSNPRPSAGGQANVNRPRPPRNNALGARSTRHNLRLDNSTPEQRAKRSMFFADMQRRRYELGYPPMSHRRPHRPR